jgi:acyl carrier protein
MIDEIRQFVIDSLKDMNYDVRDLRDDDTLGPAGLDLESLVLAELAFRVEDHFGVKFGADESDEMAGMTVGEFCAMVADRRGSATSIVGR